MKGRLAIYSMQFILHLTLRKSSSNNCRITVSESIGCCDIKSQFSTVLSRSLSSQCICEISNSQHHRIGSSAAASVLHCHCVALYLKVRPCEGRVPSQLQNSCTHDMQWNVGRCWTTFSSEGKWLLCITTFLKLTTNFIVKSFLRHRIISLYIMHQLLFSLNCKQSQIYTYTYTIHICEHRTCIREYEIGIIIVHVRLLFTLLLSLVGLPCFTYTAISWCCVPPIAECFDPFNMIAL